MTLGDTGMKTIAVAVVVAALALLAGCEEPPTYEPPAQTPRTTHVADPTPAAAAFERGKQLYDKRESKEAVGFFETAARQDPKNSLYHHWLGWAYYNLDRHDEALAKFQIANNLKDDPNNLAGQGWVHMDREDFESARRCFSEWCKREPTKPEPYVALGRAYIALQRYRDACVQFGIANGFQENADHYVWLGWATKMDGRPREAIEHFRKADRIKTSLSAQDGIGTCLLELGQYESAFAAFARAWELAGDDHTARNGIQLSMANCHVRRGNYRSAQDLLGQRPCVGMQIGKSDRGIRVISVWKGWPADMADIQAGDVLVEFGGRPLAQVPTTEFLANILGKSQFGATVPVKVLRGGSILEKKLQMGITADMGTAKAEAAAAPAPAVAPATRWAVVVGISTYQFTGQGGLTDLPFAQDDATQFAAHLRQAGWSADHIKCLTNAEATERNIRIALESWLTKARSGDTILLFWAGHGYPDPDDPEKVYFACYDTDIRVPATGYRMDQIRRAIEERQARNVVIIADTCHAGKLITRGDRGVSVVSTVRTMEKQNAVPKGWVFMVSADADRQAVEHSSWRNGAFTHCLLDGLGGKADGFQSVGRKDGRVTLGELRAYLTSTMPEETQRVLGAAKHPLITTSSGDPSIWDLTLQAE
jgi:tetratricopeptide (TPR) repeat protein